MSTSSSPSVLSPAHLCALGAFALALALGWATAIAYAVHPALPYNPVRLPYANALNTLILAPQGWSFFTRNPREAKQYLFQRGARGWESVLLAPHGRLRNAIGLNRASRAQGVEMALVMDAAKKGSWVVCEDRPIADCLTRLPAGIPIANVSPNPTLCGTIAIAEQRPIPWAWAKSDRPIYMPARIMPVEATC